MSTAKATTYTGTGAEHAVQDQENAESMLVYMVRCVSAVASCAVGCAVRHTLRDRRLEDSAVSLLQYDP